MTNFRTTGMVQRADKAELDIICRFDTFSTVSQYEDRIVTIAASGSYTVTGMASIRDVTIVSQLALINVTLDAGSGAITIPTSEVFILRGVNLTSLQISNPGSSSVEVRLVVGG